MARSVESLMASGSISTNAIAKRTKVQKSKMAPFEDKGGDEGSGQDKGLMSSRSIDKKQTGPKNKSPKAKHIDNFPNTKKFPAGAKWGKGDKETNPHNQRMKGTKSAAKNYYGGPSNRSAG